MYIKILKLSKKYIEFVNRQMAVLSGALLSLIVIILLINIFTRGIGKPLQGLSTLTVVIMIAVIYLGLSHTEQEKEHASVDMLPNILPPKVNKINTLIMELLKLVTIGAFFIRSIKELIESYTYKEMIADVVNIQVWPAKLAMTLGLLFFLMQIILNIFVHLTPRYIREKV